MVRGLRKYLTPFAPDQSGAVSLLYELGGMVVILDAGGCTGNICGFDEPRWSSERSAIFSAGLRDMDAIMGRDRALVEKIAQAQEKLQSRFIAIVGTPVPAVIGTDYQALRRMLQKKVSVPILCIETNGMKSFEYGAEKTYLALLEAFAYPASEEEDNAGDAENRTKAARIGVFGTFPMTESDAEERSHIAAGFTEQLSGRGLSDHAHSDAGFSGAGEPDLCFYGHGASLADYRHCGQNRLNLVTAVPGMVAAKALEKRFGTLYKIGHPGAGRLLQAAWEKLSEADQEKIRHLQHPRILIVQEQILGNSLRDELRTAPEGLSALGEQKSCAEGEPIPASGETILLNPEMQIQVMSFFKMLPELMEAGDRFLAEETELWELLQTSYDLILGDPVLQKMLPKDFSGCFLAIPEPAISGFPALTMGE